MIQGKTGTDQVCMGDLCAKHHRVLSVIDELSMAFISSDGIMGLGKQRYNDNSRTYVESLYAEGQIPNKMCAFLLGL